MGFDLTQMAWQFLKGWGENRGRRGGTQTPVVSGARSAPDRCITLRAHCTLKFPFQWRLSAQFYIIPVLLYGQISWGRGYMRDISNTQYAQKSQCISGMQSEIIIYIFLIYFWPPPPPPPLCSPFQKFSLSSIFHKFPSFIITRKHCCK